MAIKFIPQLLPKTNLVVSLSMGIDSLCVLHFIKNVLKRDVQAYHFNHKLRPQNEEMEENARHFCMVNNIPLWVGYAKTKLKTEADCRNARLDNLKNGFGKANVITGHHLDDAVESYLLNCFRGNAEFLPIPFKTDIVSIDKTCGLQQNSIVIHHPFLLTTKNDFWQYIQKNPILKHYVCHDETNIDENIALRNWIRNRVRPTIEEKKCINLQTIVRKKIEARIKTDLK